jgi:hypothetical protein
MGYLAIASIVLLAVMTIVVDARRTRTVAPLTLLTISNLLWVELNPSVWLFSPSDARYFGSLVSMIAEATEDGVVRVLFAGACFQFGLAAVAILFATRDEPRVHTTVTLSDALARALYRLALALLALGLLGVVLIGLRYNGSPLGLYDLRYGKRTEFMYDISILSFMLDLVQYGAAVLVTTLILRGRNLLATGVLVGLILHATLMKSKFPILCVSTTFAAATFLSGRLRARRLTTWLPLLLAATVLVSLSFARSAKEQDLTGMFEQVASNRDVAYQKTVGTIWENDFPGAAAASYIVMNTEDGSFNLRPLQEALMIFVPRFIYDRGPSQADEFAAHLLGARAYFAGAGISWSPVCDGYRLFGFVGVFVVALAIAFLGAALSSGLRSPSIAARERACVLACICAPCFILASRNSLGGTLKTTVITVFVGFLPTWLLGYRPVRSSRVSTMMERPA